MASWQDFCTEAPELSALVRDRFEAHKHKTMATLRADGSPRICGTEVEILAGQLWIGGMPGNRRFADLRRDPRVAIHSGSDEPDSWVGDARVSGVAREQSDQASQQAYRQGLATEVPEGPFELFRIDLTEAVVVRLDDTRKALLIDSWRPGEPVRSTTRS